MMRDRVGIAVASVLAAGALVVAFIGRPSTTASVAEKAASAGPRPLARLEPSGAGTFGAHSYRWLINGQAAVFYFEPAIVQPGADGAELLEAVRHVLVTDFKVTPDNRPPRPHRDRFLQFTAAEGLFDVAVFHEADGSVHAFGVTDAFTPRSR